LTATRTRSFVFVLDAERTGSVIAMTCVDTRLGTRAQRDFALRFVVRTHTGVTKK